MSTNANCGFFEKEPGEWYYELQEYPYGDCEDYTTSGPFRTFAQALRHLDRNHANPGGWSISPLPGCKHDLVTKEEHPDAFCTHRCDRCGASLTLK